MKELTGISRYLDELIKGKDKDLNKIQTKLKSFFKGKTQEDFDKLDKDKLQQFIRILNVIENKESLKILDRAMIDHAFHNKKPLVYYWVEKEYNLDYDKFKKFRDSLVQDIDFGDGKENIVKWTDWIINDRVAWDDEIYENKEGDFKISLNISHFGEEMPEISIFMIGDKKYKKVIDNCLKILK